MEELCRVTKMDENTGCAGPGNDSKKACILYFYGDEISCISLYLYKDIL